MKKKRTYHGEAFITGYGKKGYWARIWMNKEDLLDHLTEGDKGAQIKITITL